MRRIRFYHIGVVAVFVLSIATHADPNQVFKIKVTDRATGRGVPLVELRTTNDVRWITDSNGIVAIDDAGLMGRRVFFSISSHGYIFPKDGFGYAGVALEVKPGGGVKVEIQRQNIAERLYRITGEGIYRDSLMVGEPAPISNPLTSSGQVMGQDTVEVTRYRGKLYWFWGDTNRYDYPLGNFHTSGATSLMPGNGGLNPDSGIDLTYFTDNSGFSKSMLPNKAPGPVWIGGLCTIPDSKGTERLICNYARMKGLSEALERGVALFNDERQQFEPLSSLDLKNPRCPLGHPTQAEVSGVSYIYSAISDSDPIPGVRVARDLKHLTDAASYESYTCLAPGSRYAGASTKLDRDAAGTIRYGWKPGTGPVTWKQQQELVHEGKLKPDEALIQLRDVETGKQIQPAGGSVFWNSYLRKWVMIFGQFGGASSLLGEIWFSYADTPTGPWVYARKIVTHNNYTFYNPTQDPFLDQQGGKRIFFEGTYTHTFSDNKDITPRYDYNQIMYGLSLDEPRLYLPAPVYEIISTTGVTGYSKVSSLAHDAGNVSIRSIPFFAIPGPHDGLIPLYEISAPTGSRLVTHMADSGRPQTPLVYAAPMDAARSDEAVLASLYEYHDSNGAWIYSTDSDLKQNGLVRSPNPLCRVWPNPMSILPLDWSATPLPGK